MFDRLADELRLGAFVTTLAGGERLEARSDELDAQRSAAGRGLTIERALLLADASRSGQDDVRELVDLDRRAGVRTYLIDAATALPPIDLPHGSPRFAMFDEEVVCTADGPVWSVSRDPRDLGRAMSAAAALRGARQPAAGPSPEAEELVLAEPLARSAPLARALAPAVCRPVGAGVPDCASYHGWVQYMRLLDLVQSPQRHGQFYRSNLAASARSGKRRVLVAGAADYSMLAHVLAAYEEAGQTADITVIDRCPTPLRLCHWYARLKSVAIHTEVANVCDFESAEPFDVICTDALLVMLSSGDKPRALSHLAGALRPGGRLITTIRIAPAAEGGPQRFDEEGAVAFAARAREEAARRAGLLDVDGEVLAREAHRYVSGIVVYPARSPEQLVELYGGAGLRLEELRILELAGRTTAQEGGPGAHQTGTYARMVATRD